MSPDVAPVFMAFNYEEQDPSAYKWSNFAASAEPLLCTN